MKILCQEHYDKVVKYAKEIGDTSLDNCLKKLEQWENNPNCPCEIELYRDFAPHSFGFRECYPDGKTSIKQISGAGGQLDFVLGAYLSNGGKSFICCSSTFTDKQGVMHSRIRPTLAEGSIVTDTRANTHYVVTEYGMVNLKGLSSWQKAEALISVAHPDFRDELIAEAEKMHIWRRSNK